MSQADNGIFVSGDVCLFDGCVEVEIDEGDNPDEISWLLDARHEAPVLGPARRHLDVADAQRPAPDRRLQDPRRRRGRPGVPGRVGRGLGRDGSAGREEEPVWNSTTGLGGPDQTSEFSSSVKSKSIRLIFG